MKTKQRGADRFPVANEIFTDRVVDRHHLAQFFAKLCATSYEPLEKPVLSFYGVGGGGKTTLLSKALAERQDEEDKSRPPVTLNCVLCDVDTNDFKPDMETMQFFGGPLRQWLMMSGIKLHQFDRLYLAWWDLTNPNHPPLKLEDRIDGLLSPAGQVADTLSSFVDVLGSISSGIQVGQLAKGVAGYFKAKKEDRKFKALFGGDAVDFSSTKNLQKYAPAILAEDIRAYLRQNPKKAFCLAFDGFERIQADAHGKTDVAMEDLQWSLKELFVRLAEDDEQGHEPRAGMILLGREKLRWHEIYKQDADADIDWVNLVDSHILTALAEEDARYHLSKVIEWCQSHSESGGLGPRLAQHFEAILESANENPGSPERRFHPFSLDLAVEMVAKGGERFRPEDLGSGGARQLSQRFLDQMRIISPSRYKAYQVLALSLDFDKPLFDHLVQKGTLTGFAPHEFPLLVDADLSYIKPDDLHPGRYRFHRKMQEALVESFRGQYLDKASQVAAEIVGVVADHFREHMRQLIKDRERYLAKEDYNRLAAMLLAHQAAGLLASETFAQLIEQFETGLDDRFNPELRYVVHLQYAEWVDNTWSSSHPKMASSLTIQAVQLRMQGDDDTTETLYRRALAIREQTLGPNDPKSADSLENLAHLLDFAEAEPLHRRALDIREKALGPNDPKIVDSLDNLAHLHCDKGDYTEAELLFRRALDICEKTFGSNDPKIVERLEELAYFLKEQGEYTEAEVLLYQALAIREQSMESDPEEVVNSLNGLARFFESKGDFTGAETSFRRVLEIREKTLGPDDIQTVSPLYEIAICLQRKGEYIEAETLLREALTRLSLEPEIMGSYMVANCNSALGKLLQINGRCEEAHEYYAKALAIKTEKRKAR